MDYETRVGGDSPWQGHRKAIYLSAVIAQELEDRPPDPLDIGTGCLQNFQRAIQT